MDNKIIVTIGRQFGSGGREIGKKIAEALNISYYDKELLIIASKESGLSTEFLEKCDEKKISSLLYSLIMGQSQTFFNGKDNMPVETLAARAQRDAIVEVAKKGSCVIVGRCADSILDEEKNIVKIFVSASKESRIERVCKRDNVSKKEAEEKMIRMDKKRKSYYDYYTGNKWGEAANYDLCINSSKCGTDEAVKIILDYINKCIK